LEKSRNMCNNTITIKKLPILLAMSSIVTYRFTIAHPYCALS